MKVTKGSKRHKAERKRRTAGEKKWDGERGRARERERERERSGNRKEGDEKKCVKIKKEGQV